MDFVSDEEELKILRAGSRPGASPKDKERLRQLKREQTNRQYEREFYERENQR